MQTAITRFEARTGYRSEYALLKARIMGICLGIIFALIVTSVAKSL